MKKINLGASELQVPAVSVGCMRIDSMDREKLNSHIRFCLENGLNFFDNADIYGGGRCEEVLGNALNELSVRREDVIIQSKYGIIPGVMYDSSKRHILDSVDKILQRLKTDYLDVLAIHRPDALAEPEQIAEAFEALYDSGKVRCFGVSNHNPMQIELIKKYAKQPILVNQLQLSIASSNMIANGLEVNMTSEGSASRDGSVLDYCRLNDITIQAWSPFQYGFFDGVFIGNYDKFPELNKNLDELAQKYGVTPTGIATAWILRHPARIQMIAGTTNTSRMQEIINGAEVELTAEEWYRLYLSAGHVLP